MSKKKLTTCIILCSKSAKIWLQIQTHCTGNRLRILRQLEIKERKIAWNCYANGYLVPMGCYTRSFFSQDGCVSQVHLKTIILVTLKDAILRIASAPNS